MPLSLKRKSYFQGVLFVWISTELIVNSSSYHSVTSLSEFWYKWIILMFIIRVNNEKNIQDIKNMVIYDWIMSSNI